MKKNTPTLQHRSTSRLTLLNPSFKNFSEKYQKQAQQLGLFDKRGKDPHIERLLEGLTHISTHIQQQIEDSYHNLSYQLAEAITPQYLKPYPSTTIIQLKSLEKQHKIHKIPQGTLLKSNPTSATQTVCQFRTCFDLVALPIELIDCTANKLPNGKTVLELKFTNHNQEKNPSSDESLMIYINTARSAALELMQFFLTPSNVVYCVDSLQQHAATIESPYLNLHDNVIPNKHRTPSGQLLLLDYFHCLEKFLFICIKLPAQIIYPKQTFTIRIISDQRLQDITEIHPSSFILNATPAINLYPLDSEPHFANSYHHEQSIVIDNLNLEGYELYDIIKLHHNQSLLQPLTTPKINLNGYSNESKKYLHYNIPPNKQMLSTATLLVHNQQIPYQHLKAFDIEKSLERNLKMTNITHPNPCFYPPSKPMLIEEVIGELSLNIQNILSIDCLKNVLAHYCWHPQRTCKEAEAIIDLSHQTTMTLSQGIAYRCLEVFISINDQLLNQAEIFLWQKILHLFITSYVSPNFLVKLTVKSFHSQKIVSSTMLGSMHFI